MNYKLGEVEMKFADLIWNNEPIPSGVLVKLANEELEWKKSTTYTIIRKLCEKGIFSNDEGIVTSLVSKAEYHAMQTEQFVEETFEGSLPKFLVAFATKKKLSEKEIQELQKFIDEHK